MSTSDDVADLQEHVWLRWTGIWHTVFAVALLVGVVGGIRSETNAVAILGIAAALGGWYAWINVVRPPGRPTALAGGLLASWGLWLIAIWLHVAFVPVGAFLAAHVCYLSLRWAIPVAALFVAGVVTRGLVVDDGLEATLVGPVLAVAVVGIVLVAYVESIARQSAGRASLIEQLHATRADLVRTERERAMLEERRRVARDVHDTLAQSFASVVTQLQATQASREAARSDEHVEQALAAARVGLEQARRIVWDLDTEVPTLEQGLETLAAVASGQGITVDTTIEGAFGELPEDVRLEFLSIARESLTNVARHAGTNRAEVRVTRIGSSVAIEIRDEGRGFDPLRRNGGYGLRSIRARAARIGADAEIVSNPEAGTRIRVEASVR